MSAINDGSVFTIIDGFEVENVACFPFPVPEGCIGLGKGNG